jgi:glycogen debranching enzyme
MREVMLDATKWLGQTLIDSRSGLIEYCKQNPKGISNQVWKDSEEFYVHEDKQMANHEKPIASIEVQGLAYDALMGAADFMPKQSDQLRARAKRLRDRTIELLWLTDRNYFALGLDYDDNDTMRIIKSTTANPGALLDTTFFDDLTARERQTYISAIATKLMTKDFLTNAGIRSRSLAAADLIPFWDYHGSYVTWPKETYDIAKGMRRQGLPKLGAQLENRLINLVIKTREYPEFVYVDEHGRIYAGAPSTKKRSNVVVAEGTNTPERLQAWTASALMAIVSQPIMPKRQKAREQWLIDIEGDILGRIPRVNVYLNPLKLWLQYPTHKYRLGPKQP